MRSVESVVRLHRFRFEEKKRQLLEIQSMISEFRRKQDELDQLIAAEEERTRIDDPAHYNYSMTAKSLRNRKDNLLRSMEGLEDQLKRASEEAEAEEAELRKVELLAQKEGLPASGTGVSESGDVRSHVILS